MVPQSDSPVRIHQINIGEGEYSDSPEMILENLSTRTFLEVTRTTGIAQPKNCYDESRIARETRRAPCLLPETWVVTPLYEDRG